MRTKTMMKRPLAVSAVASALLLSAGFALAADQERAQEGTQSRDQQQIYGSQLMTPQERAEYRAKMRAAKTAEERELLRSEHHERMKERARARNLDLPDEPPARGSGMGPGAMRPGGGGMGPGGGGMGPGDGRGR